MKFRSRKFIREMMCKQVEITACLFREYVGNKRTWKLHKISPRHGWVVGVRFVQTGFIDGGCYDEPRHFCETGSRRLVYLVSPWPTMSPLKVPPENVRLIHSTEFSPYYHTEEEIKLMSEGIRNVPRDEKGRWLPPENREREKGEIILVKPKKKEERIMGGKV